MKTLKATKKYENERYILAMPLIDIYGKSHKEHSKTLKPCTKQEKLINRAEYSIYNDELNSLIDAFKAY